MEYNVIATGIELVGTTVKTLEISNDIIEVEREAKRSIGLNINEPHIEETEEGYFAQLTIDFGIEVEQPDSQKCKIDMTLEGAFISTPEISKEDFLQLVMINGAAALIGIARGKIESVTSCVFNNGKISIPFVNVVEYYKNASE